MALLLANANHDLDKALGKIQVAYDRAIKTAEMLLDLTNIDVVCLSDPSMVIPEIGVGGFTPNSYLSYLYINPEFKVTEDEIYNTLCHELHHAKRYKSIGYGETLLDSMIFEGLAIAFEEEVSGKDAFMPAELLARNDTKSLIAKIEDNFSDKGFEHFRWFIFDETGNLPRWAGYEVGYYLVRHYLSAHKNKKASELVHEAATSFIS